MFSSQRSDLFSQDDYLTPATQQQQQQQHPSQGGPGVGGGPHGGNGGGGFLSHFAISSPSPIKKKSRSSRRGSGRAVALPAGGATIHEGDEEADGGDLDGDGPQPPGLAANPAPCKMRPPLAPARGPPMGLPGGGGDDGSSSMEPSSTGSTACSSGSSMALGSGGAGGDDNGFADFRNLGSQGLTQSVVDGFGSLRMNGSSPDEDGVLGQRPRQMMMQMQPPSAMQCSQDGACILGCFWIYRWPTPHLTHLHHPLVRYR